MSQQHTDAPAVVRRLQRPPVRAHTMVRSNAEHTFDAFVRTIAAWWPVKVFSAGKELVRDLVVEPRLGGRVFETWQDGTVVQWGELRVWAPPARLVMTWIVTPQPTEVEFTFAPLGPQLTRVTVEHRGWDAFNDEELGRDCALPGGYRAGAYQQGWDRILASFADTVGRAD